MNGNGKMIFQLYVTDADIEYGKRFSKSENPINLAINRTYKSWNIEAHADRFVCTKIGHRKRTIKTPNKITKFLLAFHSGERVKSFRIQIDLPG